MIDVNEWAEFRRLHPGEGMGIKAIARHLGIARNTVKSALRSTEPPAYRRQSPGSALDAVEADIRRLLAKTPDMAATVVA
ncbi:MAG TPA: IS21 family transposase, partial [Acidimicrobiales bacterium]|nr:IS21 family transposase [Acidimicrobiales bacterium]